MFVAQTHRTLFFESRRDGMFVARRPYHLNIDVIDSSLKNSGVQCTFLNSPPQQNFVSSCLRGVNNSSSRIFIFRCFFSTFTRNIRLKNVAINIFYPLFRKIKGENMPSIFGMMGLIVHHS